MKNKKLLFFFSFVLIFVIVLTGWWFINFYFAKDFHQKIQQRLSNQGITFSIRKHVITGYPFYVENIFYNVNLLLPKDSNKTFAVSSLYVEKLVIVYPVWNPDDLSFSISGSSKFTLKEESKTFLTNQDSLEGKIVFNKMKEANLLLKKFQLAIENEKKLLFIEEFRLSVNQFFLNKKSDTGEHFKVVFNFLSPDYYLIKRIFAHANIESFQGQININGFLPLKEFPDSIQNWSQAGGFVEIKNFLLKVSGLESILNGSLTLDQNLQPLLVSTLKIKGYHSLLDEMGRSQTINPKTKALGNIILNFFSRSNATDEGSTIQIPLTIQDQWLSLGSFKVKKISSINW